MIIAPTPTKASCSDIASTQRNRDATRGSISGLNIQWILSLAGRAFSGSTAFVKNNACRAGSIAFPFAMGIASLPTFPEGMGTASDQPVAMFIVCEMLGSGSIPRPCS